MWKGLHSPTAFSCNWVSVNVLFIAFQTSKKKACSRLHPVQQPWYCVKSAKVCVRCCDPALPGLPHTKSCHSLFLRLQSVQNVKQSTSSTDILVSVASVSGCTNYNLKKIEIFVHSQ